MSTLRDPKTGDYLDSYLGRKDGLVHVLARGRRGWWGVETKTYNDASLLVVNPNPELLVSAFEEGLQPGKDPVNSRGLGHAYQTSRNQYGEQENRGEDGTKVILVEKELEACGGEGVKGPDADKWCDYHRARGHDTENCWTLMNKIERLIKEGFLGRYVERKQSGEGSGQRQYNYRNEDFKKKRRDDDKDQQDEDEGVKGVVTTIAGGFVGGGETSSAWRRYVRTVMTIGADVDERRDCYPMISFPQRDFEGIQAHQDDPMVIEVNIAKYKVQRVLVDQGSSADILYWEAFKKLQIPSKWLLPFSGSLVGFAGESVEKGGNKVVNSAAAWSCSTGVCY
ncbi:hypothetical protein SESBI_45675 [Sesbania bispinosa]|nr:hypothetical protein SESBI_45675 [Sesbania bispinosa]